MPKAAIGSWQRRAIQSLEKSIGVRSTYIESDDSYRFRDDRVFAYAKILSPTTETGPAAGMKFIVQKESWTVRFSALIEGNDWFGSTSQHVFVSESDSDALAMAIEILRAAKLHAGASRR